jgi:2-succinyl-5-enolpyruvyl-6-hydroxy-3-cyclohexene-1-carboxylate synthase
METKYYSAERNVQILVSLLKQHGIKKIIASPGTTNMPFVASVQYDKWFDVISCVW